MKRCPECGREYDNSMMFCLDDGTELLYGPASAGEPATAILPQPNALTGGRIREIDPSTSEKQSSLSNRKAKPMLAIFLGVLILAGGFASYMYYAPYASKQIGSIAVMPFINESGNSDVEYMSDGLTETIIRNLSQLANRRSIQHSGIREAKDGSARG